MTMNVENVAAKLTAKLESINANIAKLETEKAKVQADIESLTRLVKEYGLTAASPAPTKGRKIAVRGKAKKVKAKAAPKAAAAPKAKVVKKAKKAAKGKAKTTTPAGKKNAAAGRAAVAEGKRPTLKNAMVQVLGKKVLNAAGIIEALNAKGWMPDSSNPRQYIAFMLSSNTPEVFERAEKRGFYRVRSGAPSPAPTKKNGKKGKAGSKSSKEIDAKLQSMLGIDTSQGTNVSADPFKDAGASD